MNQEKQDTNYGWMILTILLFSQTILSMGAYGWGPLGPFLKKSLLLTSVQIGSLTSILYLTSVVFSIPAGMSVDRWGAKVNLFICMMLMGIPLILASFIGNYIFLLILIAFTGASYGMINPIAARGLTLWFDTKSRATAFGIRQTGVPAGGAIAGVLLIYLAQMRDWSLAVFVVGLLSIGIGVIGFFLYREFPHEARGISIPEQGTKKGMSLMDLVRNRNLLLTFLMMTLLCLGQSSISAFLVLYLKEHLHFPAIQAGSFLTLAMITGGAGRIFWGVVSDKLFKGRRLPVMKIVCALATISALAAGLWTPGLTHYLFIIVVVFFGLSFLGFQGVAVTMLVEVCGPELAGRATGLGVTIAWAGMVLGPLVYGAIVTLGYSYAWLFVGVAALGATLLCQAIHETDLDEVMNSQ
ncbi:MAG: MFS transporter [Thermodesulfobacteriota bacterium]|nr:MFS transporter [Thermodesulfobacteriota bacterium]